MIILLSMILTSDSWAALNEANRIADRQTILNEITDSWATIGKSDSQSREIRHIRRLERRQKRLENLKTRQRLETHQRLHPDR